MVVQLNWGGWGDQCMEVQLSWGEGQQGSADQCMEVQQLSLDRVCVCVGGGGCNRRVLTSVRGWLGGAAWGGGTTWEC